MIMTLVRYLRNCYKSIQSFRVTCLFTGQYGTREYGTIAGVIDDQCRFHNLCM